MPPTTQDAVATLCPGCGLCCDGTLFADVRLQASKGDRRDTLESLGLPLRRQGRTTSFSQPCPAFENCRCSIYDRRPAQCRAFECGQLKRLADGSITRSAAERTIRQTLRRRNAVLDLLRRSGNTREDQPLTVRFRDAVSAPIDLEKGEEDADLRGALLMAMNELMAAVEREFLR